MKLLRGEIQTLFLDTVCHQVPEAAGESNAALLDSLPELLSSIEERLRDELNPAQTREIRELAEIHATQRANLTRFSLDQVLQEYRILRSLITKELRRNGPVSREDEDRIHDVLDLAMVNSGRQFMAISAQREERYEMERIQYETILRQMPAAVIVGEAPSGKLLFANERMKEVWGHDLIPSGEISEYAAWKGWHPDGTPIKAHEWPLARTISTGEIVESEEVKILWPNGEERILRLSAAPVKDRNNHIAAGVVICQDVTESKRNEDRLAESERRYRSLFTSAPVGMAEICPISLRFREVNPQYCEMLGYTAAELKEKSVADVSHPADLEDDLERLKALSEGKIEFFRKEKRYLRKDGSLLWAEIHVTSFRSHGERPAFNIAVAMDVSDRKRAEQRLHEVIGSLENERHLREQFVSTLTHDLKTPLAASRMSAQMIERKPNDAVRIKSLSQRVVDGIDRANRMIEDLLDANRIQAGQTLPIQPSECDILKVAREVVDDTNSQFGERCRLTGGEREVTGSWDCYQLRRVFENLIQNAVKYGDPGSPIDVEIGAVDGVAVVSVHNAGEPIPPHELPRIFEPFRRSETARKQNQQGWGIGLALVRSVVEAHGGRVEVKSEMGAGTTFTVRLPRVGHAESA